MRQNNTYIHSISLTSVSLTNVRHTIQSVPGDSDYFARIRLIGHSRHADNTGDSLNYEVIVDGGCTEFLFLQENRHTGLSC